MKKTVAQVDAELQKFKAEAGDVKISSGTCWNSRQLGAIIERYSRYGEMIKCEITVAWKPGQRGYHYAIYHKALLNPESRTKDEYVIAGLSGHEEGYVRK